MTPTPEEVRALMARLREHEARFWSKARIGGPDECWEWIGSKSYGQFFDGTRVVKAPRFALALALGHYPEGETLHSCDNPRCVNPAHLRDGTHAENIQEAYDRNRIPRRKPNHRSVLTPDLVKEIRAAATGRFGEKAQLAKRFHVAPSTIARVLSGAVWGHIEGPRTGPYIEKTTILEIRQRAASGETPAAIAASLGRKVRHVGAIIAREVWPNV